MQLFSNELNARDNNDSNHQLRMKEGTVDAQQSSYQAPPNDAHGDGDDIEKGDKKAKNILMKAAHRFFKNSPGEEDKPVQESIRVFNNFRIRSSSPQTRKLESPSQQTRIVVASGQKFGQKSNNNSTGNLQQKNRKKVAVSDSINGVSPTRKRLARYRAMKDGASAQIGKDEDEVNTMQPAEQLLEEISRFSASMVLQLEDSLVQEAISNLGLTTESLRKWIDVSDFYSIQESMRMQMRRYLTALNEVFFQIEAVIKERDRLLAQQVKNAVIQKKMQKSPERSDNRHVQGISQEVSILGGAQQLLQPTITQTLQVHNTVRIQKMSQDLKNTLKVPSQMQLLDQQAGVKSTSNIVSGTEHQDVTSQTEVVVLSGIVQSRANISSKAAAAATVVIGQHSSLNHVGKTLQAAILKSEERSQAVKRDLQAKFQAAVAAEKRLTELRVQEAVKYEQNQKEFEIIERQKKEYSEKLKDHVAQMKIERIVQHNAAVDERRDAQKQVKSVDERKRFKIIQQMRQRQIEEIEACEQKEEQWAKELQDKIANRKWKTDTKEDENDHEMKGITVYESDNRNHVKWRLIEEKEEIKRKKRQEKQERKQAAQTNTWKPSQEHLVICKYEQNRVYQEKMQEEKAVLYVENIEERMNKEAEFKARQKELKKSKKGDKIKKEKEDLQLQQEREAAYERRLKEMSTTIAQENEKKAKIVKMNLEELNRNLFDARSVYMQAYQVNKNQVDDEQECTEMHVRRTIAFTIESQRSRAAMLSSTKRILEEVEKQERAVASATEATQGEKKISH